MGQLFKEITITSFTSITELLLLKNWVLITAYHNNVFNATMWDYTYTYNYTINVSVRMIWKGKKIWVEYYNYIQNDKSLSYF